MAGLTAAVADLSLKSNHDQQGQQFCGQENAADAAASETHPSPNVPLPEEPVLPSTDGHNHNVRKEPSFEADRDAADAGQQQPIQGAPEIRKLFSVAPYKLLKQKPKGCFGFQISCTQRRTFTTSSVLFYAAAAK